VLAEPHIVIQSTQCAQDIIEPDNRAIVQLTECGHVKDGAGIGGP
jgi:hypothetical protein